jgi:hypothetical protein
MFIVSDYYDNECRPIKCYICERCRLIEKITDRMGYITMQYEVRCSNCDAFVGYWSYGYFDPSFVKGVSKYLDKYNAMLIK